MSIALNTSDPWADLGIDVSDDADADPPWPIDTGNVSGPSAGLVLALAYIDAASAGDLTAGLRIAATGTINATEQVGDIGGIQEKLMAAHRAGAEVFFVPANQVAELRGLVPPGLEVVGVDRAPDAVAWLWRHGATDQVCQPWPPGSAY